VKKYNKYLPLLIIIFVLVFGAYGQIKFADNLIKSRSTSFLQMRQGFEWIKDNTPEDSIILGQGIEPYSIYYAERRYEQFPYGNLPSDNEGIFELVNKIDADYLVAHAFTTQPSYLDSYLQGNTQRWTPINVFYIDQQKQQPIFVIYKNIQ